MNADLGPAVAGMFFAHQVDPVAIDNWLAERGLEGGHRYPHEHCPIDPHAGSHGDPVIVVDGGVFCHHCNADGNGFRPWHVLIPARGASVLEGLVRHFTHWVHASIIIEQSLGLSGRLGSRYIGRHSKLFMGRMIRELKESSAPGRT